MAISIQNLTVNTINSNSITSNNIASKNSTVQTSTLIWAIVCSFLLHALLAATLPNIRFDTTKEKPIELKIELMQPIQPKPIAEPTPEPPQPEPIKPIPEKVITPKPKVKQKVLPSPEIVPVEPSAQEPVQAEPQQPTIITATPKADTTPVITVPPPPPEPSPPPAPSEQDVNAALNQYGSTLGRAIAKHKQYPKIAQMRGWQGQCLLDLKIDSAGNVQSASIKESSGYESLDKQALEMLRKASPFPTPPDALKGRSFNITVPISFKLE